MPAAAVVWLLHRGADLTLLKDDGWRDTTLHYAAGSGSLDCVQALLAWGADPTAANALGGCRWQLTAWGQMALRMRIDRSSDWARWAVKLCGWPKCVEMPNPLPALQVHSLQTSLPGQATSRWPGICGLLPPAPCLGCSHPAGRC